MRKTRRSDATNTIAVLHRGESLPDLDARAGRVSGAQVAFGAPGPRIDLDRVLESWRDGTTVGGSAAEQPTEATPAPKARTVSLSDGTTISFTVAGAFLAAE
jgi:hypothetical protein